MAVVDRQHVFRQVFADEPAATCLAAELRACET